MRTPEKPKLATRQVVEPVPLARIESMEEVVQAMRAGTVTAMLFAAKQDGFVTWFNFYARTRSDCVNLLGQLELLRRDIAASEANNYP